MKKNKKPNKPEIVRQKAIAELRQLGVLSRSDLIKALEPYTNVELKHEDVLDYTYNQGMIEAYSNIYSILENVGIKNMKALIAANIRGKLGNIENIRLKYQQKEVDE